MTLKKILTERNATLKAAEWNIWYGANEIDLKSGVQCRFYAGRNLNTGEVYVRLNLDLIDEVNGDKLWTKDIVITAELPEPELRTLVLKGVEVLKSAATYVTQDTIARPPRRRIIKT
jgi:hypothetical protein